jgi:hypothetical protein
MEGGAAKFLMQVMEGMLNYDASERRDGSILYMPMRLFCWFLSVFMGLVLRVAIDPKSNLHCNFKTNPKTDDVKTKKRL